MGDLYPFNPGVGQTIQSDARGIHTDMAFLAHLVLTAAETAGTNTSGVHAAVTDTGVQQVITTGITNPPYPRNISATPGGVSGDIKAVQVIIVGTDIDDQVITETLPVFTVNSTSKKKGVMAFKTVTSITIPAHDGTGATTKIGFDGLLGLPWKRTNKANLHCIVWYTSGQDTYWGIPTIAADPTVLAKNTVSYQGATTVDAYFIV